MILKKFQFRKNIVLLTNIYFESVYNFNIPPEWNFIKYNFNNVCPVKMHLFLQNYLKVI